MSKVVRLSDKILSSINEFKNIYMSINKDNDITNSFIESMDDIAFLDYVIFYALECLKASKNP